MNMPIMQIRMMQQTTVIALFLYDLLAYYQSVRRIP